MAEKFNESNRNKGMFTCPNNPNYGYYDTGTPTDNPCPDVPFDDKLENAHYTKVNDKVKQVLTPEQEKEIEAKRKADSLKGKFRVYAFLGIPPIVTIYGIYAMRKLPDYKPNEATLTGLSVVAGIGSLVVMAGSGLGGGLDKKTGYVLGSGVLLGASGVVYSASRGILKMNSKNSLILSAAAAGIIIYGIFGDKLGLREAKNKKKPWEEKGSIATKS